jgi:hypothetical protein
MLKTDINYLRNCVFVDEAAFNINMRAPYGRSLSGTPAIVETSSTRAISHTILGAIISSQGVVSVEVREPLKSKKIKVTGGNKRKNTPATEKKTTGTTAGHYMRFISKMLNEMDKFSEMENFYIIMDNASIHKPEDDIDGIIERRGYRSVRLPPYSPELNPIEQFWALLKACNGHNYFT